MSAGDILQLLVGLLLGGMLFQISKQLGCIKTEISHLALGYSDHEERLRKGGL